MTMQPPVPSPPAAGASPPGAPWRPLAQTAEIREPYVVKPPVARARKIAVILSAIAVTFAFGFGIFIRKAYALRATPDDALPSLLAALVLLLIAMLLRMAAAVCELLWLERTWNNLPEELRRVGPVKDVNTAMVIGFSILPGIAWVWKLGLVVGIANGFESLRGRIPFRAAVPKKLGMAAVITGWIPGLNVYAAPFLWELFARRTEIVIHELMAAAPASPRA
jgi:hypothetical protein